MWNYSEIEIDETLKLKIQTESFTNKIIKPFIDKLQLP